MTGGAVLFWLALWHMASIAIDRQILLVSPLAVLASLFKQVITISFWSHICFTGVRIIIGFFLGVFLGVGFAIAGSRVRLIRTLLQPLQYIIKATPVASFIILVLIWFHAKNISIIISFLMIFPILYTNTLQGLDAIPRNTLEMAAVFRVPTLRKIRYLYIPYLMNYLIPAMSVATGLAWKSGVAAEVIGVPDGSIGDILYHAKLYFDTADLLAWTVVIILCSIGFEKIILKLLRFFASRTTMPKNYYVTAPTTVQNSPTIHCRHISVTFPTEGRTPPQKIFDNISTTIESGTVAGVIGASGKGKTTFIRAIMHRVDYSGEIIFSDTPTFACVFQEHTLIPSISVLANLSMVVRYPLNTALDVLDQLGLKETASLLPGELSGGMQRRVAIVRALLSEFNILILDEPFSGLDYHNKQIIAHLIQQYSHEKTIIFITHDPAEAALLHVKQIILLEK